jgi:hypothetical protein
VLAAGANALLRVDGARQLAHFEVGVTRACRLVTIIDR